MAKKVAILDARLSIYAKFMRFDKSFAASIGRGGSGFASRGGTLDIVAVAAQMGVNGLWPKQAGASGEEWADVHQ